MRLFTIVFSVIVIGMLISPIHAQDYRVITVGFRELQLAPEDMAALSNSIDAFRVEPALQQLIQDNDSMFWEELGDFDESLEQNTSLSTYAIVRINESGFFQTIVALDDATHELEWIKPLSPSFTQNYSRAVQTATDFFANDGHYWGLSEEIVIVPGTNHGLDSKAAWLFRFYLVGESERWTLLIDTNGVLQDFQFEDIPCQTCINYTGLVIIGLSSSIIIMVLAGLLWRKKHR